MLELSVKPVSATENTLSMLGRKYVTIGLNRAENLMALTSAAGVARSYYGPTIPEMQVKPVELPETVKGVLANYAS